MWFCGEEVQSGLHSDRPTSPSNQDKKSLTQTGLNWISLLQTIIGISPYRSFEINHQSHRMTTWRTQQWPNSKKTPPPHPPSHCNTHLPYQGSDLRVEEKAFKCLWNRLANQFRYSSYLGLIQDKEDSETDGSWIKNPGCFQSPTVGIKKGKQIAITSSLVHVWYDTPLLSTNSTLTRSNVHKGLNRWLKSSESGLTNLL